MNDEQPITIILDELEAAAVDEQGLRTTLERTLRMEGWPAAELTVVLTSDAQVQQLNRDYRGLDEPTDVLSFSAQEATPGFIAAPETANYLGDVIIAFPYAAAQAAAQGRTTAAELALLAVHGVLHLLGYDHATPAEEQVMWAKQAAILGPA